MVGGIMCHDLDREEETLFSRKTTMGLSTICREIRTEDYKVPMFFKVPQKTNNRRVCGWTRVSTRWDYSVELECLSGPEGTFCVNVTLD